MFGVDRHYYGRKGHPGRIYDAPDLVKNNLYRRIEPDDSVRVGIEQQLGLNLDLPYVLVQSRRRSIGPQVGNNISEHLLIEEVTRRLPTVVLSFETKRLLDSASAFEEKASRALYYSVRSFREQSCLISHARKCIFLSEGDLGSHTYLPPFMGKDVVVVASRKIFKLPSAPLEFWNKQVFTFGGQMIPYEAESLFESSVHLREGVEKLLCE
jgi:hypothetical protein